MSEMPAGPDVLRLLEEAIERKTGEPIESLRAEPIAERRSRIERTTSSKLRLVKWFPFIGRGNIMRNNIRTAEEIDEEFLKALNDD